MYGNTVSHFYESAPIHSHPSSAYYTVLGNDVQNLICLDGNVFPVSQRKQPCFP